MARAHEQIGTQETDRRTPEHDMAVQYLQEQRLALATVCLKQGYADVRAFQEVEVVRQERVTGFIDLLIVALPSRTVEDEDELITPLVIAVEVKTGGSVGDAIRQMRLYQRAFVHNVKGHSRHPDYWVLATTFTVSVPGVAALRAAGIKHVQLADNYNFGMAVPAKSPII